MILFRIFFNLFGMATRLLILPFHLILHNFFLVLVVVAILIIYFEFSGDGSSNVSHRAPSPPSASEANPPAKPGQIDPVRRYENGDSAFSTDLYASMTDAERQHYSQMFYSVMENVVDNTPYSWQAVNIAGTLTPGKRFYNQNGVECRRFKETLKVHSIEQSITGIGCDRGDGGWCKLKSNATPACGLSTKGSMGIMDSIRRLF